ncbi:capsid assembly protein [Rhizobium phage RHEph21]|uniref:Capsid assembly protein n=2 Tax=root TaxID=1 RepID=A0AAE7VMT9_9CAUD|nr:capsid assembly protein [Rhizobium phage RHEph21]
MENEVNEQDQLITPGSEEHDALMIEKFQKQSGTEQVDPPAAERPSWLPEKFEKPEDLAASYAELEKKLSGNQQEAPKSDATVDEARDTVNALGLDFDALGTEFAESGELSDASYKALADKGLGREIVDAYIEGQQAKADLFRAEVLLSVGGEQSYEDISAWAASNLTNAELQAYNAQVEGGNLTAAKMAVQGLKARFEAENGNEPSLLNGVTGGDSTEVFRSTAELTAAMRDPRYKKDPAYRADVERKLSKSSLF